MNEQDQPVNSGEWTVEAEAGGSTLVTPDARYHSSICWHHQIAAAHNRALAQLRQPVDLDTHTERDETRRWLLDIGLELGVPLQVAGDEKREPHEAWRGLYSRILEKLRQPVSGTEAWPDIGPDPLKLDGEERAIIAAQYEKRICDAMSVQQKGIPDQTALVWRIDLSRLWSDFVRFRAGFQIWQKQRSSPQPVSAEADEIAMDALSKLDYHAVNCDDHNHAVIREAIARATAAKDATNRALIDNAKISARIHVEEKQSLERDLKDADEVIAKLRARLTAAEEQLAVLRKDSERLDWLKAHLTNGAALKLCEAGAIVIRDVGSFREEIDAALATKKQQ